MNATDREHRLVYWFKEVMPNVRVLGQEIQSDITEAAQSGDIIKMAMVPFAEAVKLVVSGPNAVVSGILDDPIEPSTDYKTLEEGGAAMKNLVTGHPIRAINRGWNALTVWPEDLARTLAGLSSGTRMKAQNLLHTA